MKTYLACIARKHTCQALTKIVQIEAASQHDVIAEMKVRHPDLVRDIEEGRAYVDTSPNWT